MLIIEQPFTVEVGAYSGSKVTPSMDRIIIIKEGKRERLRERKMVKRLSQHVYRN
jgi:hypothetical protein